MKSGKASNGNQRVLVTAGASGIGREIARAFVAHGAKVFVSDIDAASLDALSREVPGVMTKVCDNSKRTDIEALTNRSSRSNGPGQVGGGHECQPERHVQCNETRDSPSEEIVRRKVDHRTSPAHRQRFSASIVSLTQGQEVSNEAV